MNPELTIHKEPSSLTQYWKIIDADTREVLESCRPEGYRFDESVTFETHAKNAHRRWLEKMANPEPKEESETHYAEAKPFKHGEIQFLTPFEMSINRVANLQVGDPIRLPNTFCPRTKREDNGQLVYRFEGFNKDGQVLLSHVLIDKLIWIEPINLAILLCAEELKK